MLKTVLLALIISTATVRVTSVTDETALYVGEGSAGRDRQLRTVAGWPAPFLADDPSTSVIHELGIEDTFRPGPFAATLSFWIVSLMAVRGGR